jgi:hypothetical protein
MAHEDFFRPLIEASELPKAVRVKWTSDVLEEGFVPFPKKLLRSLSVLFPRDPGVEELAVILAVVDARRPGMKRNPSLEFLSFLAGIPSPQLNEVLQRLTRRGWGVVKSEEGRAKIDLTGFEDAIRDALGEEGSNSTL